MVPVKIVIVIVVAVVAITSGVFVVFSPSGSERQASAARAAAEQKWRANNCSGPFDERVDPDHCFFRGKVQNSPGKGY